MTLTGAGGVGKTRLAMQVAAMVASNYADGAWYVDLAPLTDPELVPATAARALGLPDQPGRSPVKSTLQFIGDRQMLVLLDNCEHLLDASADLTSALLAGCPRLTVLTTSREPIGSSGEVTWRVPGLSLADDAVRLFGDRAAARTARLSPSTTRMRPRCTRFAVASMAFHWRSSWRRRGYARCRRNEILAGLQNRFRLLTGGSRTAVRRQQTLRASVDWSHALLTEPERTLFRRLAAFMGGFDLEACREVVCDQDLAAHQVLDVLALLIDKSLVVAESDSGPTRYWLLETIRQYAQEKLSESRRLSRSETGTAIITPRWPEHWTLRRMPAWSFLLDRVRNRNRQPAGCFRVEPGKL